MALYRKHFDTICEKVFIITTTILFLVMMAVVVEMSLLMVAKNVRKRFLQKMGLLAWKREGSRPDCKKALTMVMMNER